MNRVTSIVWMVSVTLLTAQYSLAQTVDLWGIEGRAKLQTVMVNACGELGAGIVVGEDREWIYILTAYHVVYGLSASPCKTQSVIFVSPDRHTHKATFERTDKFVTEDKEDLTAIKVKKMELNGSRLSFSFNLARDPRSLKRGDHLFIIGNPNDSTLWYVPPEPFFFAGLPDRIEFGPSVDPLAGMSGGPICNADGEIVGMVLSRGLTAAHALPIDRALTLFKSWNVGAPRLFAERRYPVVKSHYTEIGADFASPSFTGALSEDGPGIGLHIAHGVTRPISVVFDTTILYAKGNFLDAVETQQILIPSGGLQLQPFANFTHKSFHETLGGFYLGGGLGWGFVTRSVQGTRVSVEENRASMMIATEAGYRVPLPPRGWGVKIAYKVYQPIRSEGLERASVFTMGIYGVLR